MDPFRRIRIAPVRKFSTWPRSRICALAGDLVGGSGAFSERFSAAEEAFGRGVGGRVLPRTGAAADGDGKSSSLCWLLATKIPGSKPYRSALTIMSNSNS